ncbi:hypothetical protein [Pseudomonas syringae]|uniref:hypothetical protein n=1 Tax=Pseudomonas syringae TaxID=317 RepID=UPI000CDB59A0|nr:hypothetical protein [Pseudomonas syringae]MCK9694351.1 hypothetical protein [Pseudomonas syringae pv. syringae]MCK9699670.1 hypothetical protein [Pseudomonas syringae pv. syringae]MCK9729676.1 hypothetical protein [Pseudomonas syringae pv. syringae]POR61421.1 hypothetical protein BKM10_22110 [Pseudomonas syringae pv. syringae]
MKISQYFLYSGISTWIFEELCDELKQGIEWSLERRGLKGVENQEFRDIVIGETTATPLLIKYSALISTELESQIAKMNNSGLQIKTTSIEPLAVLKKLQLESKKIISERNKLIHNSWSPQLLSDEKLSVKAFSKKISERGSTTKVSELNEADFRKFIRSCELLKRMISYLNYCLSTQSSLDRFFEITDETILPINNIEMEKHSILVEVQEQIDILA